MAEAAVGAVFKQQGIHAQGGVAGNLPVSGDTAAAIGSQGSLQYFIALGVKQADGESGSGQWVGRVAFVGDLGDPEFEVHFLAGAVDGAVSDAECLDVLPSV